MNWRKHIHSDLEVMMGEPVVVGTWIPVDLILEKIEAGETFEEVGGPPQPAAMAFVVESLRAALVYPVSAELT